MKYRGSQFRGRRVDEDKLKAYGFCENDKNRLTYTKSIADGAFSLVISFDGEFDVSVFDTATNEEYTLVHAENATGEFVGRIRSLCEETLFDICEKCTEREIFKSGQAKAVIGYIKERYGADAEYLWEKFPFNAVFRIEKNRKWFAILMTVEKRKLGISEDGAVEVAGLRAESSELETLVDGNKYLLGYHMNKKHWYTICLDGRVDGNELFSRIDKSYSIT